jgi:hypothetical protein
MSAAEAGTLASASAAMTPDSRKSFLVTERSSPIRSRATLVYCAAERSLSKKEPSRTAPLALSRPQLAQKPIAESR